MWRDCRWFDCKQICGGASQVNLSDYTNDPDGLIQELYLVMYRFLKQIIDIKETVYTRGIWPFKEEVSRTINLPLETLIKDAVRDFEAYSSNFVTGLSAEGSRYFTVCRFMYKSLKSMQNILDPVDIWVGFRTECVGYDAKPLKSLADSTLSIVDSIMSKGN